MIERRHRQHWLKTACERFVVVPIAELFWPRFSSWRLVRVER